MSKNFELMQQAGVETPIAPAPNVKTPFPMRNGHRNGNVRSSGEPLDIDKLAREESLKLVQRVFLLQAGEPPRAVVFAGIDHGNGCSRTCARVAETLARNIQGTVCLVDANLRTPGLPEYFGVTNHHGLTDALLQEEPIRNFVTQLRPDNLWLLSCGSLASDSANLLNSDRLKTRFAELRGEFDYVLIDAPPLGKYNDAMALGRIADGLIFVLEANATRREAAIQVTENLRASQVNVLGAVLNKRTFPIPESLYHRL